MSAAGRSNSAAWALAFTLLWAAEEALTGSLLARLGIAQVVWMRFALHLLLVLAVWWRPAAPAPWHTRRPGVQMARAIAMVAVPACWAWGLRHGVAPATLMSVFWLSPLLILVLARLVLGERAPRSAWIVMALASLGVFALDGPHDWSSAAALAWPLAMAAAFGLFVVLTRGARGETDATSLFYAGAGAVVLLAPLAWRSWVMPTAAEFAVCAGVALLGFGSLVALQRLLAGMPATRAGSLAYLQIPFAIGIGWWAGALDPGWRALGALGVIVLAAAVAARQRRHPGAAPPIAVPVAQESTL